MKPFSKIMQPTPPSKPKDETDPVIAIAKFYERLDGGNSRRIRIITTYDGIKQTNIRRGK